MPESSWSSVIRGLIGEFHPDFFSRGEHRPASGAWPGPRRDPQTTPESRWRQLAAPRRASSFPEIRHSAVPPEFRRGGRRSDKRAPGPPKSVAVPRVCRRRNPAGRERIRDPQSRKRRCRRRCRCPGWEKSSEDPSARPGSAGPLAARLEHGGRNLGAVAVMPGGAVDGHHNHDGRVRNGREAHERRVVEVGVAMRLQIDDLRGSGFPAVE